LSISYKWTKKAVEAYKKKELAAIALMLKTEASLIANEELKIKVAVVIGSHLADSRNYFKQPHKLRQNLKEIYFWIKIIQETLHYGVEYETELHQVLDDFGHWQDLQVLETRIKHFRKDFLPKSFQEYESVKTLETDVKEKKENLLKATLNKTDRLLTKVEAAKKEKSEA
jgi:hypothetical protein